MKNVHVYDILSEGGEKLVDLIIPMYGEFNYLDVFKKVQEKYLEEVDSYSYSVIE